MQLQHVHTSFIKLVGSLLKPSFKFLQIVHEQVLQHLLDVS